MERLVGAELEDSEEDEDFDPEAGGAGGDDDDAGAESEEDDAPRKAGGKARKRAGRKGGKRGRNIFIDDAAEEEDDDDEDEDGGGARRGKKKRSKYIDDMAEDADDAEDEDEDVEEDFDDLIANDAEAEFAAREGAGSHQRMTEQRRKQDELTDEQLEEFVRKRYEDRSTGQAEEGEEDAGPVAQQLLLPTKADARLWAVQCRPGSEREVAICLLQRAHEYAARGEPLGVKAAFAHDHIKGYLWVEAHKQDFVRAGLKGLRGIFHSKPLTQVKLDEMPETIAVPKPSRALLERQSWARVRGGMYKEDLCRVVDVDYSSGRATIEVVPRIDYSQLASGAPKQPFGRAPKIRPQPRAFDPNAAREAGGEVQREARRMDGSVIYVLDGKQRFRAGYLQRQVAITGLRVQDALPPLDELQKFKQAAQSAGEGGTDGAAGDMSSLADTLAEQNAAPAAKFIKGDRVKVVSGDLIDMMGRVERLGEDGLVFVRATNLDVNELIEVEARDLIKHFNPGDHVKVVAGQLAGETGMLLGLEEGVATLFLDSSKQEARLFARDLTESADIVASIDRLGPYEQHDLVSLDPQTVGVIVECGPDCCQVLTNRGTADRPEIRTARLPDIQKKLTLRNAVSNDQGLNPVAVNDMVDVKRGAMSGKAGTVKYIFQGALFLQSREVKTHGGFFCVNARDTRVRGAARSGGGNPSATPGRGGVQDILASLRSPGRTPGGVFGSPQLGKAGQSQGLTGASGGGFSGRSSGPRRDDGLIGRTLPIKVGPHRGYKGRVVSATETHCRIELEAQYKTVTVKRSDLKLEGDVAATPGSRTPASPWELGPTTPMHPGGRTPMHSGAQTPMHAWGSGSATPMHDGSMTPGRAPMTPGHSAWNPVGAQTPIHPSADTPSGATTPATWDSSGYTTPGSGFGGTPQGSQWGTPAYSPPATGTPGMYSPGAAATATPGTAYSPTADTPGAATPAAPYSPTADTPAGGWPTEASPAVNGGVISDDALWRDVHVSLPDGRAGVVQSVAPDGTATIALGETTAEGSLRLAAPEQTADVPKSDLQLVPPRKKDSIRVILPDSNAPAGFSAELMGVQDQEGIIKQEGTVAGDVDIKFVDMSKLGRIFIAGEA